MLSSIAAIRRFIFALVKFLSRLLTALNLLPSIATSAWLNRLSCRHSTMNWRQTCRIARPLSLRKLAIVLKSGISRAASHISSMLRCVSCSSRRLDWIRFRYP